MASEEAAQTQPTFRTTLWTVILTARDLASPHRREALETLIQAYWKPLYTFIRRRGSDPEASRDLTQGFFTALIEKNFLQNVDREKGRFRTFLLAAFRHYMSDDYDRRTAVKRGGGVHPLRLDFEQAESEGILHPSSKETTDRIFLREWAIQVLAQAMRSLEEEYRTGGRSEEFLAIRQHLGDGPSAKSSYSDLARRLGLSESDIRNRMHRARGRLRGAILGVIRSYSAGEEDAQEELRDLFSAFLT